MNIRLADESDLYILNKYDRHITEKNLLESIRAERVYIAEDNGIFCGWLRYNLFWDNTPFMNMLYLLDNSRLKGYGRKLVSFWEEEMYKKSYKTVMTSTASDEYAQHFYMKLGYKVIGGFLQMGSPYEVILEKYISKKF